MYQIGEHVVCPGHGVGVISSIEKKRLGEHELSFYEVKMVSNGMKMMVPTDNDQGIRPLTEEKDIESVFSLLRDHDINIDRSTWNRRYRDYMEKINTGSLLEIADVLRSLLLLRLHKKLSFSERKMVELCRDLIVREVSLSTGHKEMDVNGRIDSIFG